MARALRDALAFAAGAGTSVFGLDAYPDEAPVPFVYRDPGSRAAIGRTPAVAFIGGRKFRGVTAWIVRLLVHRILLIGFRSRTIVLIHWAWDYFLFERCERLIPKE